MNKYLKISIFALLALLVLFAVGLLASYFLRTQVGSSNNERVSYEAIGTNTTSSTLTAAYTGNTKTIQVGYMTNLHLDMSYWTPSSTNRYASILVEGSNDGGTTYFPVSIVDTDVTTNTLRLSVRDMDGNVGVPIEIPGDRISTTSLFYKGMIDLPISSELIKISAKESGSANFGKIYVRATLTSK